MGLESFNRKCRAEWFRQLSGETFDLLIIGGGITGASIFRDAALRRMRVALVEAKDFASATSGRSSKLIHGGLRYLKNLGFKLAWESCHERNLHIRLNKRLVRPVPFLVPIYRGRGESRLLMRLGMSLYEILSGFQNYRLHRFLSREETLLLAPGLPTHGLTGACLYYDAITSDTRWTVEIVKDGIRHGGIAANYAPVTALVKETNRVMGARAKDLLSGNEHEIRARAVVNATGVFADRIRQMDSSRVAPVVKLSKGTHLVFAAQDVPLTVTTAFASPLDGRPLFLVQREGCFLYGTTDDWEDSEPGAPAPGAKDVQYLLDSIGRFMPEARLNREKVQFAYSGFRPLLSGSGRNPSEAPREDYMETSPSGLISIVGGKLTTARLMAIRALEHVTQLIGQGSGWLDCQTHVRSIGGTNEEVAERLAVRVKQCPQLTSYIRILFQRYGLDADEICVEATNIFLGQHPDSHAEPIRAEVEYVCRHEMVCTLEDLIDRRAGFLYWNAEKRVERLQHGAVVIRAELRLTEEQFETQLAEYRANLERFHSLPSA